MGQLTVVESFENDDYLRRFLHEVEHETQALSTSVLSVSDQLKKLSEGIEYVDAEILRMVTEKHEDLLSQVTWIDKLEGVLQMMATHIQSLLAGVERLSTKISAPYLQLAAKVETQRNILETLDTLRHVSRLQIVTKRLAGHVDGDSDLTKQSEDIRELTELWNERDVTDIEILEDEQQCLKNAKREVGKRAKKLLLSGIQMQKTDQMQQAVQVLYNIDTLQKVTAEITLTSQNAVEQMIKDNLDPKMLIDGDNKKATKGIAAPVSSPNFRPKLWSTLEKILESILQHCGQIEQLELALRKPRTDSFGARNKCYIDDFATADQNVAKIFWLNVTNALAGYLNKYANESLLLKQALEGEYPKFLRFYIDLCKRLEDLERPEKTACPFEMNKKVISSFEKSYLSKSVNMVLDPVHNMFSKDGVPAPEEVDVLIGKIRSELSVALFDPNLSSTIARNITKAVRLFCSNCDGLVDRTPEATQVIGPRKRVQDTNIAISNITEYLKSKLHSVMSNLNTATDATMIVSLSLVDADNLITAILNPILTALEKAMHAIILTIHKEDFSKDAVGSKVSTSLYMRELQEFISRAYVTYLKPFDSEDVVQKCACATGQRCVELFTRHVSIVRPLGAHGRAKLVNDCNQLEAAVSPLLGGEPKTYRTLRSFRSLLSQTPQEVLANSVVGETVPVSTVLFYLFSYAPEEMKSPHQSGVNWSPEELSLWLDSHPSERDRLGLVSGSLGRYCNLVRQTPGRNFDAVYAVMAELIQKTGEK